MTPEIYECYVTIKLLIILSTIQYKYDQTKYVKVDRLFSKVDTLFIKKKLEEKNCTIVHYFYYISSNFVSNKIYLKCFVKFDIPDKYAQNLKRNVIDSFLLFL